MPTLDHTHPETFGHPDIAHPYADLSLSRAVNIAMAMTVEGQITCLRQARDAIEAQRSRTPFNWITGAAAMDLFDAAIDGRDIEANSRLIGSPKADQTAPVEPTAVSLQDRQR